MSDYGSIVAPSLGSNIWSLKFKMLLKSCAESWYHLNTLYLDIIYHSKQESKWFKTTKQTSKYAFSNVYYRIFIKMSQISKFPDLFKKAKSEYLINETYFLLN